MQTSAWNFNVFIFIYSNVRFMVLHVYFYYCCNMSAKITALLSKSLMNIECWDENNFHDLSWHEAHERGKFVLSMLCLTLGVSVSASHALTIQFSALHGDDFIKISLAIKSKKFQGPRDQATFYDSQIKFKCVTNAITRDFWLHVQLSLFRLYFILKFFW